MTLREALAEGWREADTVLQQGYVSRKPMDDLDREVHEAGGTRRGLVYILLPNKDSTRYCYRRYYIKEG